MSICFDGTNNRVFVSSPPDNLRTLALPNQPAFHAIRTAGHVMGNSNVNIVVYNSVSLNRGSYYNSSNGRFTAGVAGRYFFSANGMVVGSSSGDHQLRILKNGNNYNISNPGGVTFNVSFGVSAVIDLAVNDFVEVAHYDTSTSTGLYAAGGPWNGFCGFLIG